MIDYLEKLERYLFKNELETAFDNFIEMLSATQKKVPQTENDILEIKKQLIVLSGKFHDINKRCKLGIIEPGHALMLKGQISYSFTELIHDLANYSEFYAHLKDIDEENTWLSAVNFNTFTATEEYLEKYPEGKYKIEAKHLLKELSKIQEFNKTEVFNSFATSDLFVKDFSKLTNIEWWQMLSPPWKKIFRIKLKFSENPSSEDLERLMNIEKLNIHGNREVLSIEALKRLKDLRFLNISDTKVSSINVLRNLTNLEVVWFNYTPISDLSPLRCLISLVHLDFENTEIEDLTPISNLQNLEQINCTLSNVNSLYPIYEMPNLKVLFCDTHLLSKESIENFKLMNPQVEVNNYSD